MSVMDHYIALHSFYRYEGRFVNVKDIEEAAILVTANNIKSEIIGNWLYCYCNVLIGYQLLSIGFRYSEKHGAYIFSGDEKQPIAPDEETLDEIRTRLGSRKLK